MNNANGEQAGTLYQAFDGGDAISNLNPDDIESMNILKGASAAALYGSQAANGVILITTKSGKSGRTIVDFSSTTTFENAMMTPDIQGEYGQAKPGVSIDSWGPKSASASNGHVDEFFRTGVNLINSLSVTSGDDKTQYFFSYANTTAKGITPENDLGKHNFNLRVSRQVYEKLKIDAAANYISQKINNRPYSGFYFNPILNTYMFPVGDDFNKYKEYEVFDKSRNMMVQNYPYIGAPGGYTQQNPYWITNRNQNENLRNRFISRISAKYDIIEGLNAQVRLTYDRTDDRYEQRLYASTVDVLATKNGEYTLKNNMSSQLYTDFLLNYSKSFNENIDFNATLGANYVENVNRMSYQSSQIDLYGNVLSSAGLHYANVFSLDNMSGTFAKNESLMISRSQAVFATAQVGFKNTFFIDATGRSEWSSTLTDPSQPFFYPSVGLTYVLTETIEPTDFFSYAKFRGSYSQVGNALPFGVANMNPPRIILPDGSIKVPDASPLGELTPERTNSWEIGADLRFFNSTLTLDMTYYNALSSDQLFTINAPIGHGTKLAYINGGKIRNSGIELALGYKYINDSGDFTWEPSINFSKNVNTVEELSDELEGNEVVISSLDQTKIYQLKVKEGGSYGDMYGYKFQRDSNGNIMKDPNTGAPMRTDETEYIGNTNPDYMLGFNNRFNYKNFTLSFLIDGRFGGQVISMTEALLDGNGLSQRTADARNSSKFESGGTEFEPEAYYKSSGGINPIAEQYTYSATNIRLREASLGYSLPTDNIDWISKVSFSVIARNLFFFYKDAPYDPDLSMSAGNGLQGLDAFNAPSTRTIGFGLNVSF
jgi:TonB-linked SusC/RagA family outer membrane protein